MMEGFGWAKNPMIKRIHQIRDDVDITLVYGSKSWVDHSSGEIIKKARPNSNVKIHVINHAGHHIYADTPDEFNFIINKTCESACEDEQSDVEENSKKDENSSV